MSDFHCIIHLYFAARHYSMTLQNKEEVKFPYSGFFPLLDNS